MAVYVKRKYICKKCSHMWKSENVVDREDPTVEPCPACKNIGAAIERPKAMDRSLRAGPLANKATEFTWEMAQQDYGMTNMNDHLRAGDLAAKIDNPVSATLAKQGGMFGGNNSAAAIGHMGNAMQMASAAKAERTLQKVPDPVQALQMGAKQATANYLDNMGRPKRFK